MSGFLDIISVAIVVLGIVYMICCIATLISVRKNRLNDKELDKSYSYFVIIAILYVLFWLIKLKQ